MDAEIKAVKDAAETLGKTTIGSRKAVEDAIADLKTKKEAAHKVIDSTYDDVINAALKAVIPTNVNVTDTTK